ncbi:MAG TPA: lipid II flippase MurJ [Polyangiaceae bacterium]|nr:lipid II flippase MurJ [Polyangiaceae bacterium]
MARSKALAVQTVFVTLLSFLGLLLGLGNSLLIAYLYGASPERDAYLLAAIVPTYLVSLFSGNISILFIPVFIQNHTKDEPQAWRFASSIICYSGLILLAIVALATTFAKDVVARLAPAFTPAELDLTTRLLRVMMPSALFGGLSSVASSLYYAEQRFLRPNITALLAGSLPLITNLTLHHRMGMFSLAWGTTLGSAAGLLLLLPGLLAPGKLRFSLNAREDGILNLLRSSVPLLLASLLYRFNTGFERILGARLPTGSISFLAYATQIVTMLSSLTSSGIATTFFPALSRAFASNDMPGARRYLAIGVRAVLIVALPASVLLIVFAHPIVQLLLERGAFDRRATSGVSNSILLLLAGYVASSLGNVVTKCIYVAQKTAWLAPYTIIETIGYVALGAWLSKYFSYLGLAAASSARDCISVSLYLAASSYLMGGIQGREMWLDAAKLVASSLVMAISVLPLRWWLAQQSPNRLTSLVVLCLSGVIAGAVYFVMTVRVFRIEEGVRMFSAIAARLPGLKRLVPSSRV